MQISSTAFPDGTPIPRKYSGDGEDLSPPFSWSDVPDGTRELALICEDPDAPTDEPWVHWIVYHIPATARELGEAIPRTARVDVPHGMCQGRNSWPRGDTIGYRGPAPPRGHGVHHYHFRLFALDRELRLEEPVDRRGLDRAMHGHVLAEAEWIGTYERP